jgi:uncharacterized protein with ParB-like and HNH nuclease domain
MKIEAKARALDKIFKRRDRYEIPDWQREEVWSEQKKQSLINSILKSWTLPKFYFLKTSDNPEEFEVVDGQQRLAAIFDFFDNLLSLPPSGSKPGKLYKQLSENQSDAFDDFEIQYDEITEASEPEIKEFFQRLQQGLPLTSSERLNAVHSNLQKFCKDLTKSKLFTASIPAESGHGHIRRRGGTPAFLEGRPWVRYVRWSQERTFMSGRGKASKRPSAAFERQFTVVFE